jgi:hypothetical protein
MLLINGDFFNSDGSSSTTTKGTPQSDDTRWQKAFTTGWKLIRDGVDYCKQFADVEVVINSGNHDTVSAFMMGEVLSAWYAEDLHVRVDNSPRHYKYKQYHSNMIGITHGNGARLEQLPLLMATDAPELWAATKHREFHVGHLHGSSTRGFQTESTRPGCKVVVCPALCPPSDWTVMAGYRSVPEAQSFLWHKTNGRVASFYHRIDTNSLVDYK